MIVECPQCHTRFRVDPNKVGPAGNRMRCAKCKHVFVTSPSAPGGSETEPPKPEKPPSPPLSRKVASVAAPMEKRQNTPPPGVAEPAEQIFDPLAKLEKNDPFASLNSLQSPTSPERLPPPGETTGGEVSLAKISLQKSRTKTPPPPPKITSKVTAAPISFPHLTWRE